jgi:hypothetical protein
MIVKRIGVWRIQGDGDGVTVEHRSGDSCSVAVAETMGQVENADGVPRLIPTKVIDAAIRIEEYLLLD